MGRGRGGPGRRDVRVKDSLEEGGGRVADTQEEEGEREPEGGAGGGVEGEGGGVGPRARRLLDALLAGGEGGVGRRQRGGEEEGGVGRGERGWGGGVRDSYSRAEGPPAIIFKPLQPTLELVEIKH